MGKGAWEKGTKWIPQGLRKREQFYGFEHPGKARSQSNLNGAQLRWPPQGLRKCRPCHASEHPRGGEVSKQSEWGAAPLAF